MSTEVPSITDEIELHEKKKPRRKSDVVDEYNLNSRRRAELHEFNRFFRSKDKNWRAIATV